MANLITIKDTGESPYDYTINGDSIRTIKTYTSEENEGYYICELYTDLGLDDYRFEFQSKDPATLERNITNAILSGSGDGIVPVDTKSVYFYPDAIPVPPVPVSNTLKYTIIAGTGSGEYCLPFAWQEMIDEIYNDDQFDERTSTAVVNYNCTVDWGDGSPVETFTTEDVTDYIVHDYGGDETEFTITITGTFEGWSPGLFYEYDDDYYDTGEDIKKILDWGTLKILGPYWFNGMDNAEPLANNQPILKLADIPVYLYYDEVAGEPVGAYGKSLESVFNYADYLLSYNEGAFNPIDISSWDLTGVISLNRMFDGYRSDNIEVDITQWNTSDVLIMSDMFSYLDFFNQNISNWDVSSVIDMSGMFSRARSFNQNINGWDVSSVTNMQSMFSEADSFNQPIGAWDVSSVTRMESMFYRSGESPMTFNQDLSNWDVSNVTDMGYMFYGCPLFNQNINNWDTSSVTSMARMFSGAVAFNQPLNNWDTSSVTTMSNMFANASAFNQDISSWDTSVVNIMSYMFNNAITFNQDLSSWNVANVTNYTSFDNNTPAWVLPKPSFV